MRRERREDNHLSWVKRLGFTVDVSNGLVHHRDGSYSSPFPSEARALWLALGAAVQLLALHGIPTAAANPAVDRYAAKECDDRPLKYQVIDTANGQRVVARAVGKDRADCIALQLNEVGYVEVDA